MQCGAIVEILMKSFQKKLIYFLLSDSNCIKFLK